MAPRWESMFTRVNTELARKRQHIYKMGQRLPVLRSTQLLTSNQYRFFLDKLREYADLPDEHFTILYQGVIKRFAEHVQLLPETLQDPLGGLLRKGMLRAINTLHLFHKHYDDISPLESYALFTAVLLRDISYVVTNQKIFITDDQGATTDVWQPFRAALTEDDEVTSYKIMPIGPAYQRINSAIKPILARQIMGEPGYLWLARDLKLLAEWLDLLEENVGGGFSRLIEAIKLYKQEGDVLISEWIDCPIEFLDCSDTLHADAFWEWLLEGIEKGDIKVNSIESGIHLTEAGIFIERSAIFKQFCDLFNLPVNHVVVFTQFGNLMGLTKLSGGDFRHDQLFSGNAGGPFSSLKKSVSNGVIIGDANMVFLKGRKPETSKHFKTAPGAVKQYGQLAQFAQDQQVTLTHSR